MLAEVPISSNKELVDVKGNETQRNKSNEQGKMKMNALNDKENFFPIELFSPASSIFESEANRIGSKHRNKLWIEDEYEGRPISGLEHAFLNRLSLLRSMEMAKRNVSSYLETSRLIYLLDICTS